MTPGLVDATRYGGPLARSVWRWQLVIAFAAVVIVAVVALLARDIFTQPVFLLGMGVLVATTLVSLVVPWDRLGARVAYVLPAVDILAIGLISASSDLRVAYLWVFPITWIATYYSIGPIVAALCTVAASLVAAGLTTSFTNLHAVRLLIVLASLAFIATTVWVGASRGRATRRLLIRQSKQLEGAAERARHQEQHSAALLNSIRVGVAQVDADGRVTVANAAYRDLYGIGEILLHQPTPAVEYRARRGEAVPADETTTARAARGETFEDDEVWLFDVDGRWRLLRASAHPSQEDPAGDPTTVLVVEDITDEREAERVRATMARTISHELRNPLTAILGHSDLLLERDDLPAGVRDRLEVIDDAALRMQRLIASVLQDRDGRAPESMSEFDLAGVVRASAAAFAATAQAAGVVLDSTEEGGLLLVGDAFRVRQVVDNVVGNAVKYTPRGGRVDIHAGAAGDHVEVTVSDTGIGMAAGDASRVFDPYFRAASAPRSHHRVDRGTVRSAASRRMSRITSGTSRAASRQSTSRPARFAWTHRMAMSPSHRTRSAPSTARRMSSQSGSGVMRCGGPRQPGRARPCRSRNRPTSPADRASRDRLPQGASCGATPFPGRARPAP
ncbi:two-component sensor histidine kinase [Microbacterium barkeri]|uniref:histidine kinase n=1 Tax=Microbacterium barkeri TaxID=33917 RepID=A0A9W6LX92_9MICO|nr:two-component sensor histidine kinase [Microbacterium barkeri]